MNRNINQFYKFCKFLKLFFISSFSLIVCENITFYLKGLINPFILIDLFLNNYSKITENSR